MEKTQQTTQLKGLDAFKSQNEYCNVHKTIATQVALTTLGPRDTLHIRQVGRNQTKKDGTPFTCTVCGDVPSVSLKFTTWMKEGEPGYEAVAKRRAERAGPVPSK